MAASAGLNATALGSRLVLGGLLLALLVGAATFDRRDWPGLLGDEATYLMQAQSLAWDLDLRYEAEDHRRFVAQWGRAPEGLILQSADGGESITFGKPAFYAAWLAPFLRVAPVRGVALANWALLTLAALATARALRGVLGPTSPLWVGAFVFGSVTFAHVWWAHSDLFLACLVALSLSLAFGPSAKTIPVRLQAGRWAAVGLLLALVALSRPFYGALLLPAALAASREERRRAWLSMAVGLSLALVATLAVNHVVRGTWSSYGGTRMGFYAYTGFPAVDFPASAWDEALAERPGTGAWIGEGKLRYRVSPRLLAYDAAYFLFGRHVGVLPYFLPLLLGLVAFRPARGRGALLLAVALAVAGFFYVRAFNFYGGGGALANRYFLPLYPAFWFLAGRRPRPWWPLIAGLAATPFLLPLWTAPRAYPLVHEGSMAYVSAAARTVLPYETSLSHLKPAGREDLHHGELWVKLLASEPRPVEDGALFELGPSRDGEILIGSEEALAALWLEIEPPAPVGLSVDGATLGSPVLRDGRLRHRLELGRPTARHRMWWTFEDVWLYRLEIRHLGARPLRFRLLPGP